MLNFEIVFGIIFGLSFLVALGVLDRYFTRRRSYEINSKYMARMQAQSVDLFAEGTRFSDHPPVAEISCGFGTTLVTGGMFRRLGLNSDHVLVSSHV